MTYTAKIYRHGTTIVCGPCDTRDAAARLAEAIIAKLEFPVTGVEIDPDPDPDPDEDEA